MGVQINLRNLVTPAALGDTLIDTIPITLPLYVTIRLTTSG